MLKRITGVKWAIQFNGESCIAAYRGPDRLRLYREADRVEIKVTPHEKAAVDSLVDAGAPLLAMQAIRN